MIYRHNDIFVDDSSETRELAKYIRNVRLISPYCPVSDVSEVPYVSPVRAKLINFKFVGGKLDMSFKVYWSELSTVIEFSESDVPRNRTFVLKSDCGSIVYGVSPDGALDLGDIEYELEPHKLHILNNSTAVGRDVDLVVRYPLTASVNGGLLRITLADPQPPEPRASADSISYVNGISPGYRGNINIISDTEDLSISVSAIDLTPTDKETE